MRTYSYFFDTLYDFGPAAEEMEKLSIWLEQNKLSLHLGKTESILFGSKRRLSKTKSLSVSCNSTNIVANDKVNYCSITLEMSSYRPNITFSSDACISHLIG